MRKVQHLKWHTTASNILASASGDHTVKIWDVEQQQDVYNLDPFDNLIQDMCWSRNGSILAASSKDKSLRLFDARSGTAPIQKVDKAHEGSKTFKICDLGKRDRLLSVGFTKQSKRQFKIWDYRTLAAPLATQDIDQAAGVIMPFYDDDTNVLYFVGKGDGNIRFYEMCDEAPYQFALSEYRSSQAAKGACVLPKRACDVSKCEVVSMLKLTSNSAQPLSFIIPRRSETFQEDIFPPAYAGVAAMTAEEWMSGENKEPVTMSMNPKDRSESGEAKAAAFTVKKSNKQLTEELDAANARIAELEAELAALR